MEYLLRILVHPQVTMKMVVSSLKQSSPLCCCNFIDLIDFGSHDRSRRNSEKCMCSRSFPLILVRLTILE